jgi:hypothetical protein
MGSASLLIRSPHRLQVGHTKPYLESFILERLGGGCPGAAVCTQFGYRVERFERVEQSFDRHFGVEIETGSEGSSDRTP